MSIFTVLFKDADKILITKNLECQRLAELIKNYGNKCSDFMKSLELIKKK